MDKILCVDGNWFLYRAYHVIGKRSQFPQLRVPYQIVSWVYEIAMKVKANHALVAFDGNSVFRYDIYKEYKANRGSKGEGESDEVYKNMRPTIEAFEMLGIKCIILEKFEADDVCVSAAKAFARKHSDRTGVVAVIANKDKDTFGYVNNQIICYTPGSKDKPDTIIDTNYVKKTYGLPPSQFRGFQILHGDRIDNIPELMSKRSATDVMFTHKNLKAYFETEEGKEFFQENKKGLKLNAKLVSLGLGKEDEEDSLIENTKFELPSNIDTSKFVERFGSLPKSCSAYSSVMVPRKSIFK